MDHGHIKFILTLSNSEAFREEAHQFLNQCAPTDYALDSRSFDEMIGSSSSVSAHPTFVILDLNECSESNLVNYQKVVKLFGDAEFIGVRYPADTEAVVKLLKVGVGHFVKYPFDEEEIQPLLKASAGAGASFLRGSNTGKMICFFSPKGGSGVTFSVINFAAALAGSKTQRILICDICPGWGDVATCLNVAPKHTIRDVIDNIQLLDESYLKGVAFKHSSGIEFIAAPRENQTPILVQEAAAFETFLLLLKQCYDIVLIDCGHADPVLVRVAAMQSEKTFLIANQDVPSLRGLVGSFDKLSKFSYNPQAIGVIINRDDAKHQMGGVIKEFEKRTKNKIALSIPNDYPLAIETINRGCTIYDIQPKSNVGKKMEAFIKKVAAELKAPSKADQELSAQREESPKKKGFF
jgi:Flp pilus assembly CpaE family ATPase